MRTWTWNKNMSEDELRSIADEMRAELERLDYYSKEHTRLHTEYGDVVNAIINKSSSGIPKREHGWYLPNDD